MVVGWEVVGNKISVKLSEVKEHYSTLPEEVENGFVQEWENILNFDPQPILEALSVLYERGYIEMVYDVVRLLLSVVFGI